jgi:hypothetical protein
MECYENDFENFLLKDTTEYYSIMAQRWILEEPCLDYIIKVPRIQKVYVCFYLYLCVAIFNGRCFFQKVEECLKREKE